MFSTCVRWRLSQADNLGGGPQGTNSGLLAGEHPCKHKQLCVAQVRSDPLFTLKAPWAIPCLLRDGSALYSGRLLVHNRQDAFSGDLYTLVDRSFIRYRIKISQIRHLLLVLKSLDNSWIDCHEICTCRLARG